MQAGDTMWVTISNPNTDRGLIRAGFELAAIAEDGSIIGVFGSAGLPGAECCTIYHLPPEGRFAWVFSLPAGSPGVASTELTVLDEWIPWDGVDAAAIAIEQPSVLPGQFVTTVTGRASVDQPGPFNVWVGTVVDTPGGRVVLPGFVECLRSGSARAFEYNTYGTLPGPPTLVEVIAYPTTVQGYGDISAPPSC